MSEKGKDQKESVEGKLGGGWVQRARVSTTRGGWNLTSLHSHLFPCRVPALGLSCSQSEAPHLIKLLGSPDPPPKFWSRLSSTLSLTSPQSECIVVRGPACPQINPRPAPITPGGDRCSPPPTRPTASFLPQNEQMPQRGAQSVNVMPLGRMMSYSEPWWLSDVQPVVFTCWGP